MESTLFSLAVLSPERKFFEGEVKEVVFSTPEGSIGIMAGHEPMVVAVAEGVMEILINDEWKTAAVGHGFGEITYERTEFYLDTVEWADEIDITRAREALERAEARMRSSLSRTEHVRTQAAMSRALSRLKAVDSSRTHSK